MADGSGLQYRRHRYYDPGSGQFTQEDPIGLAGGLNLYGFANGDPVSYGDPFGLTPGWLAALARGVLARTAIGGAILSAGRALLGLNKPLPSAIARTFQDGAYKVTTLTQDFQVQRVFGGGADAIGRFLTPVAPRAEAAVRALQLPAQNAATHVADILIPAGTKIYTGIVSGSTTNAIQIFVNNAEALKLLGTQVIPK